VCPENSNKAGERTGAQVLRRAAFRGDLSTLCNNLKGVCGRVGAGLFSQITEIRQGTGLKLSQGRLSLDIRKTFSERVVMHWKQAAQGCDGITTPGGVQEPRRCGTEGHG